MDNKEANTIQEMKTNKNTQQNLSQEACDVFISYKTDYSQDAAYSLFEFLSEKEFSVFLDSELQNGEKWAEGLYDKLREAKAVIVIVTEKSLDGFNNVDWCNESGDIYCQEIAYAIKRHVESGIKRPIVIPLFQEYQADSINETVNYPSSAVIQVNGEKVNIVKMLLNDIEHKQNLYFKNESPTYSCLTEVENTLRGAGITTSSILRKFGKYGRDIEAKDFFKDPNRADASQGFDEELYHHRDSVDGKIIDYICNDVNRDLNILIVTGQPGAGKTRALYECVKRGELQNERVVIVNANNCIDICSKINKEFTNHSLNLPVYFVCDEVNKVMSSTPGAKDFFCHMRNGLFFLGTEISDGYHNFLEVNQEISEEVKEINIGPLSPYECRVVARMYTSQLKDGKVIADFISKLNDYKNRTYTIICKDIKKPGVSSLLCSLQLVDKFRKTNSLQDVETIFHQFDTQGVRFKELVNKYLLRQDVRLVNLMSGDEVKTVLNERDRINNITFDINDDMVWEMLQPNNQLNNQFNNPLFNLHTENGIKEAFGYYYDAFPGMSKTLCSFLYNLPPREIETESEEGYNRRVTKAMDLVQEKITDTDIFDEQEKLQILAALVYRSTCFNKIEELLGRDFLNAIRLKSIPDARCIRSLYIWANNHKLKERDNTAFDELLNTLEKEHENAGYDKNDISCISSLIESKYRQIDFKTAYEMCKSRLNDIDVNAPDIKYDLASLSIQLATLCQTEDDINTLWDYYCKRFGTFPHIEAITENASRVAKLFIEDEEKCENTLKKLLDKLDLFQPNNFKNIYAHVINQQHNFRLAKFVYEMMRDKLRMAENEHETPLITICLKKCQENEFQKAVEYVESLKLADDKESERILYNQLIGKAYKLDDAYYIITYLKPEIELDDYSMSNCLKIIKSDNKLDFYNAYELLQHPRFKRVFDKPHCLGLLYELAKFREQELYLHKLLNKECKDLNDIPERLIHNDAIMSTLMKKDYREFNDIYTIYQQYTRSNRFTKPDVFSSLCHRINKLPPKKRGIHQEQIDTIVNDIKKRIKNKEMYPDVYLFSNFYMQLEKKPIFKEDGMFSDDFIKYVDISNSKDKKLRSLQNGLINNNEEEILDKSKKLYDYFGIECSQSLKNAIDNRPNDERSFLNEIIKNENRKKQVVQKKNSQPSVVGRIKQAQTNSNLTELFDVLRDYCKKDRECFVAPSIVNLALRGIWYLRANNGHYRMPGRRNQQNNIGIILQENSSIDKLTSLAYAYLAALYPNNKKWVVEFDKRNKCYNNDSASDNTPSNDPIGEFSIEALSILSLNNGNDIRKTRKYFNQWLKVYEDIYGSPQTIAERIKDIKFITLGRRLKMETSHFDELRFIDDDYENNLKCIWKILEIFSWSTSNFNNNSVDNKGGLTCIFEEIKKANIVDEKIVTEVQERLMPHMVLKITK